MSTLPADTPTPPAGAPPEPPAVRTLAVRRSGRLGTRLLAILALLGALAATAYVVKTALKPTVTPPLRSATADAWKATGSLSDALRALRRGSSRSAARALATPAATAVKAAAPRVETLDLTTAQTPSRSRVLAALRADRAWIAAVGATLADPRSSRRAALSGLARKAAEATALASRDVAAAKGTVGGTGRLLAATAPG